MQPIADAQRTIDGVERDVHVIELAGHGETPLEHDEDFALITLGTKLAWTPAGAAPILADDALARVRCPTVIAAGTKDDTVPAEETLNAARATGGQSVMLECVGHSIESVLVAQAVALMRRLNVAVA